MKKFSKVLAMITVMLLGLTSTGVTAYATNPDPQPLDPDPNADPTPAPTPTTPPIPGVDSKYEPVSGDPLEPTSFVKYFITNTSQAIPDIDFVYTIKKGTYQKADGGSPEEWTSDFTGTVVHYASEEAAQAAVDLWNGQHPEDPKTFEDDITYVPAVEGEFEIFRGVGKPKVLNKAHFDSNSDAWTTLQAGDTIDDNLLVEGKQYSKDTVKIDFSEIEFPEPGVYRYIITEQFVYGFPGVKYDIEEGESRVRVLDVYVVDDPDGILTIHDYVLHTTESKIKTSEDMGSKDPNIVATGWVISTDYLKGAPYHVYDNLEDAETELERRRAIKPDDPNYDSDILAKEKQVDDTQKELDALNVRYKQLSTDAGIPDLKQAVEDAQEALDELKNGTTPAPSESIADLLAAIKLVPYYAEVSSTVQGAIEITGDNVDQYHDKDGNTFEIGHFVIKAGDNVDYSDVNKDKLKQHGRTALFNYLVTCTDPYEITELRKVIDELDTAIVDAESDLQDAEDALDDALTPLEDLLAQISAKETTLEILKAELEALQKIHDEATILEIQWTLSDKSDHYTNSYSVYDLEFGKEVEGNQGSKDKYFKYTLTMTGLQKYEPEKWKYGDDTFTKYEDVLTELAIQVKENPDGTWTYDGDVYATKEEAEAEFWDDVTYVPEVLDQVVTINEADPHKSIWTKAPSKTRSTIYESKDMTKANSRDDDRDLVFSEATDEKEQQRLVWDDASEPNVTYKYNRTDKKWQRYEDGVLDPDWTGTTPPDDATHTGLPGQQLIAEDGVITWEVYLKDGEYINLKNLPQGISYTITEEAEDYESTEHTDKEVDGVEEVKEAEYWTYKGVKYYDHKTARLTAEADVHFDAVNNNWTFNGDTYETEKLAKAAALQLIDDSHTEATYGPKTHDDDVEGTLTESVYTGYTNTRNGILPTGIAIVAGAGLAMLGIGAAGMYFFGRRKEEDDEDYEDEE